MKAALANSLWTASCYPGWRRLRSAVKRVEETQTALLAGYVNANNHTEYGALHRFDIIDSAAQYQKRVPLTTYDDYAEYITRIGNGEESLLTSEPVRMFELSSGSTAASKLIPYTDALKREFQRGIAPWIFNLHASLPSLRRGPAYWSISPLVGGKHFTPGGIPIGFESDSAYLGPLGRWLSDSVMAVPDDVKNIAAIEAFRYVTLLYLLRHTDLRLISVWNPTFLTLLLESLPDCWDGLLEDIGRGAVTKPDVDLRFAPDPKRARALRAQSPTDYESLWPSLHLISCWTDGASASFAQRVEEMFPHVRIQGKGLLATEAFVSLPIVGAEGGVISVTSHFFEFIDDAGEPRLAHQLEIGKTYSVVVTTGGGFYRYQMHDLVEVIGFWGGIPRIRFMGKADHISDWFGEKLDERFVEGVLNRVFTSHAVSPAFALLAPENGNGFRYVLYLEGTEGSEELVDDLDRSLRENFHYDYCRRLGQIDAVKVVCVRRGAESYLYARRARGQKLGGIKPSILEKTTGWGGWFER